jgi:hypothetical protein
MRIILSYAAYRTINTYYKFLYRNYLFFRNIEYLREFENILGHEPKMAGLTGEISAAFLVPKIGSGLELKLCCQLTGGKKYGA